MDRNELHRQIEHIFGDLLPAVGMTKRAEQIILSHRLLDTMLNKEISLCDAGTGIGKTLAYIVAGFVYQRHRAAMGQKFRPLVISTSSIALQTEIHKVSIPLLAQILRSDGWNINPEELSAVRKGKSHYVCEKQLEWRLKEISHRGMRGREGLLALRTSVDIDEAGHIPPFDLKCIRVPGVCTCGQTQCRYRDFLDKCNNTPYLFQICNHNLLLADAMRKHHGYRALFPENCGIIIDEAHKLPETGRDMLGLTLDGDDFRALVQSLRWERYLLASQRLEEACGPLLNKLDTPPQEIPFQYYGHLLLTPEKMLRKIQKALGNEISPPTQRLMNQTITKTAYFTGTRGNDSILFTSETESGGTLLGARLPDLSEQFQNILWKPSNAVLMVSGTLAVGTDFSRFRKAVGLQNSLRTTESVSPSPFNYKRNVQLYFPLTPPKKTAPNYYEQLTDIIQKLITAACGHALILCTSYYDESKLKEKLAKRKLPWRLYVSSGNAEHTANQFRSNPGSILLGTGALWEGMDFPGDCVSLLIIPRLPFPYPDAAAQYERQQYDTRREYIEAAAVPEMQIRLRQGFGRAIRTETDTCVVAILDERAVPGGRYYQAVLSVLPRMRKTRNIQDVEDFIRRVKPESYFRELGNDQRKK